MYINSIRFDDGKRSKCLTHFNGGRLKAPSSEVDVNANLYTI